MIAESPSALQVSVVETIGLDGWLRGLFETVGLDSWLRGLVEMVD